MSREREDDGEAAHPGPPKDVFFPFPYPHALRQPHDDALADGSDKALENEYLCSGCSKCSFKPGCTASCWIQRENRQKRLLSQKPKKTTSLEAQLLSPSMPESEVAPRGNDTNGQQEHQRKSQGDLEHQQQRN